MASEVTSRSSAGAISGIVRLLRPRHWVKSGFVLAPLLFSGEFQRGETIYAALLAVLLFSVASSAVYIVNDIRDIPLDRKHPVKSVQRPLASGVVTIPQALVVLCLLYGFLILGYFVAPSVVLVIGVYLLLNLAYTFYLKHQPVVDIFSVAAGFTLRVFAGAEALRVPVSSWMFVTTLCLALFLAAVKRRQELLQSGTEGRGVLEYYSVSLVDRYAEMSATGALVFYSLFVTSTRPELVATIPFVLFGLFRYWYVVDTLEGGESPTDVLLTDIPLIATVILWIGGCVWAISVAPTP